MEGLNHEVRVARRMVTATLLCWLALGTISYAGLPFADWVQVAGNGVRSARVAADSDGNCFVVGTFGKYSSNGELSFGSATLVTRGLDDVFVAKYDRDGQVQWVRQLGGAGSDSATALAVDSQGNCIVAGLFQLTAQFGNTNITAVGIDAFVAKLKPDGTVSWVHSIGSPVGTAVVTIAVAKRDDLIIGGGSEISASFGKPFPFEPIRSGSRFVITNSFEESHLFFRLESR